MRSTSAGNPVKPQNFAAAPSAAPIECASRDALAALPHAHQRKALVESFQPCAQRPLGVNLVAVSGLRSAATHQATDSHQVHLMMPSHLNSSAIGHNLLAVTASGRLVGLRTVIIIFDLPTCLHLVRAGSMATTAPARGTCGIASI